MSIFGAVSDRASELFNSLPAEKRKGSLFAYTMAQHTTIVQLRAKNKAAYKRQDAELSDWQRNVERSLLAEIDRLELDIKAADRINRAEDE